MPEDRLGRPGALRARARVADRDLLLSPAGRRYGVRLALCIGIAQCLVSLVHVPVSYWVPVTVTFVLKPDFGSVFWRAVLRALGTAAGVTIAATALAVAPGSWADVAILGALAAATAAWSPRSYAFQTASSHR